MEPPEENSFRQRVPQKSRFFDASLPPDLFSRENQTREPLGGADPRREPRRARFRAGFLAGTRRELSFEFIELCNFFFPLIWNF